MNTISKEIKNFYGLKLNFLIFCFYLLLNILTSGAHADAFDGVTYFLYAENLVLHHSLKFHTDLPSIQKLGFDIKLFEKVSLNRIGISPQNELPSSFPSPSPILLPIIEIPFYLVSALLGLSEINFVSIFTNPLIISGTALVIFLFAANIFSSKKMGLVSSLIFFSSFVWPYNSSLFDQPLVGLVLICALYFLYKGIKAEGRFSIELSGFFLGLVILASPGHLILIPIVVAYVLFIFRKEKTKIIKFSIILFLVLIIQGVINYERYGSITAFGYGQNQESLSHHFGWIGLVGLLFSPGKGIFFYYPIFILFPISIYRLYKRKINIGILFAIIFIASYLFFGTEPTVPEWGGNAWGPRYLVPVLPLISISLGSLLLDRTRIITVLFGTLAVLGLVVNLLGKLIWYMYGLAYGWDREELWKVDNINIMTWSWNHSPISLNYKTLMSNYIQIAPIPKTVGDYFHLGLAPCQYDSFIYCTYGLIPIFIISSIIAMLFYFICKNIRKEHVEH